MYLGKAKKQDNKEGQETLEDSPIFKILWWECYSEHGNLVAASSEVFLKWH